MSPRLAVVGAAGRMGSRVVALAAEHGLTVTRAVGRAEVEELASGGFDVAIDFSSASAFPTVVAAVSASGAALVTGTTGLSAADEDALAAASRRIAVLHAANLSVGVHVLGKLLREAIAQLGPGFDVEIVETHHQKKVDAPSGTALHLAAIAREAPAARPDLRHGREGRPGERPVGEIGVHAVRGGDVIGDHTVHLLGLGERIELTHRATSRDLFAHGALRAAAWIAGRPAGRYALADVLSSAT